MGGERGGSPEIHSHLHCFEHVKFQVVKTAPNSQLLNLQSVSRLVTVLDEAHTCGVVLTERSFEVQSFMFFKTCNKTHSDRLPVVESPLCWGMVSCSW